MDISDGTDENLSDSMGNVVCKLHFKLKRADPLWGSVSTMSPSARFWFTSVSENGSTVGKGIRLGSLGFIRNVISLVASIVGKFLVVID